MDILFPPLDEWQQPVFDAVTGDTEGRRYVVKSKRQVGKSLTASLLLIYFCLRNTSVNAVVHPTLNQSRRIFSQISNLLEDSGIIKTANSQLLTMTFTNGSEILFKSAEQKEGLRGFTVTGLLVIDEGAFIPDDVYQILFPVVDAHRCPVLIISTPLFQDGYFYEMYVNKNNITFDWSRYDTSKYLTPQRLAEYKEMYTPLKYRSEYLGEFITEGSYVFGDFQRLIVPCTPYRQGETLIGAIDWGSGTGGDYTVLTTTATEEWGVKEVVRFNDIPPTEQIDVIARHLVQYQYKCIQVEVNSIGSIYLDMLRKKVGQTVRIYEFVTTNESKREIIENLQKGIGQGTVTIPDYKPLEEELRHYAIEKTRKGTYTYNGQDGFHDDTVVSLSLLYDLYNKMTRGVRNVQFKIKVPQHKRLRDIYG